MDLVGVVSEARVANGEALETVRRRFDEPEG